jgi:hypothetical protein
MGDENRGQELPQRVRGAARSGPPPSAPSLPSVSPALSEELRRRIQAAVEAERARAAAPEQENTTEPPQTNGHAKRSTKPESAVRPGRTARPERTAQHEPAARAEPVVQPEPAAKVEPIAQLKPTIEGDELSEWLKPTVTPQPATRTEPAGGKPTRHEPAAVPARKGRSTPPRLGAQKKPGRRQVRARMLALAVITLVAVGALATAAVEHFAHSPSSGPQLSAAQLRQEAANRSQAAAWMVQQVSRNRPVACDKVMCAALSADGFSPHDLLVLGPTSPDPLSSAVIVETAAVHSLFGSSLDTAWAPAVLAYFGSGPAGVTVRVIAPHGAVAYRNALSADLAERKMAGAALLNDSQITILPAAKKQLTAGQADSRLLLALASLAGDQPISIVQFGNVGSGASAGIPLRFADLAANDPAAHMSSSAYAQAVRADLSTGNAQVRPARTVTAVVQGQTVLRVEFMAPSPLGVLGPKGSP